jgi:copper chaperone
MATVSIKVGGMSCQGCVKSVTEGLSAMAGVESAKVSLDTATADVKYDESKVNADAMKKTIYDLGFEVR